MSFWDSNYAQDIRLGAEDHVLIRLHCNMHFVKISAATYVNSLLRNLVVTFCFRESRDFLWPSHSFINEACGVAVVGC